VVSFQSDIPAGEGNGVLFAGSEERGLILAPEYWGLNEQVEELGAKLAQDGGFMVLIVDHLNGKTENNNDEVTENKENGIKVDDLKTDLDWKDAVVNTLAGVRYLREARGCYRVGIVGFGDGGALGMLSALRTNDIDAVCSFYGFPGVERSGDLTRLRIPIQGHFAKRDTIENSSPMRFIPFREKSRACGVPLDYHVYDAGHAFADPKSINYNEDMTNEATTRMYDFMNKWLK